MRMRGTDEVINAHLEQGKRGSIEEDLPRNYGEDVTVFIADGVHHGHDGVRALAERLRRELPSARFEYTTVLCDGDVAFLEWTGPRATAHRSATAPTRSWSATARSSPRRSTTPSSRPEGNDERYRCR